MKSLYIYIMITGLAFTAHFGNATEYDVFRITTLEENEAKSKLEAYVRGDIPLDNLPDDPTGEVCRRFIGYYLLHTNSIAPKMKLPISQCFACYSKYAEAAQLAREYVGSYPKDWRGWKILGGACVFLKRFDEAISAFSRAVEGDTSCYVPMAGAALASERLDLVRKMVPRLLEMKKSSEVEDTVKLDIASVLMSYSIKTDQQVIFMAAFEGVSGEQLRSRDDIKEVVALGRREFKGKDIEMVMRLYDNAATHQ